MPRKIQRKPIRQKREEIVNRHSTANGFNIQAAITVLGGVTGIIVAILWIAGRFYMVGYFGAMNIPPFQINFSVWEYAEVSWLRLIFYFLRRTYPIVVLLALVPLPILTLAFILQKIYPRLKIVDAINKIVFEFGRLWSGFSYVLVFTILAIFSYVLLQAFTDITRSGQIAGEKVVHSSSYAVQVFSKAYLPLGAPRTISDTTPSVLEYSGLRLLIFNNGKYYLFRDIDRYTCKPSQVFVITDSPDIVIVLSTITPVDTSCATPPDPPAP